MRSSTTRGGSPTPLVTNQVGRDTHGRMRDVLVVVAPTDLSLIPFVCECGHLECLVILRLSLADYNAVRNDARWFICSPGHELTQAGHERVIETRDGYVIVEKRGDAANVAERLDPRDDA
jgi:hypothetical protein